MLGLLGLASLVPIVGHMLAGHGGPDGPAPLTLADAVLCPVTGLAAWLVWQRIDIGLERKRAALRRWGWLLLLGAAGPAAMAGSNPAIGLVVLLAGLGMAIATASAFRRLQPAAAVLLWPYVAWLALEVGGTATRF